MRAARIPVARRLMMRLALAGGLVALLVAVTELAIEYRGEINRLSIQLDQIESGYLGSVAENAWLEDRERLGMLVAGIQRLPAIALVRVVNAEGHALAEAGQAPAGDTVERSFPISRPYHGKILALGELKVVASLAAVRQRVADRAWLSFGGALALVLLLSFLLYLMVYRLVTGRLVKLADYVRRVGQEGPVQSVPLPLDDGTRDEFTDLQKTFNDMHAALGASYHAIQEREARYHDLFTSSPVPLWEEDFSEVASILRSMAAEVGDPERLFDERPDVVRSLAARVRVIDVNDAAMALHRAADRQELMGRLAAIFTPSSYAGFKRQLLAVWNREWELVIESELRTLDGDIRDVVVRWLVPAGSRETMSRVIVSTEDVSDRRRAERSLEMTLEKLTEANSELERFAFIASHDLQEPVRSVVSFSQLLERRIGGGSPNPETVEYLEFLKAAAFRMQCQVDGLLDYSRAGQSTRGFTPVALDDVLDGAKRLLADQLLETGARVVAQRLPTVVGDANQLTDLFRQLMENAIKFRRPGLPPEILIAASRTDDEWRLSVRDSGIGIDPMYASEIFQVFRRLHGLGHYPGAGIGLATCRRIVERHGGQIWAEVSQGPGACIQFTLPATDGEMEGAMPVASPQSAQP